MSWELLDPGRIAERPGSSSASFRGATAGSFPRETTRTSAWAGGSTKGRSSGRTSPGWLARTGSIRTRSRRFEGIGCRCDRSARPPVASRILLVGDAAGLVDPLSGDGIYEAFVSARLASEAILAGRPEEYEAALAAALDRHAAASWKAKRVADRYPRACLWAVRAPGVFDAVAGLLSGDLAHPSRGSRPGSPAATRARATGAHDSSGSLM